MKRTMVLRSLLLMVGFSAMTSGAPLFSQTPGSARPQAGRQAGPAAGPVWITLGTGGGPQLRQKRSEPANALVVGGHVYLFDMGAGTLHRYAAAGLELPQLTAAFISHHHVDHNADLAPVLLYHWKNGRSTSAMPVIGPPGTELMVKDILAGNEATELAPVTQGGGEKLAIDSSAIGRDNPLDTPAPVEVYRDDRIRVLAVVNTHYHFPPGSKEARLSRSYSYRIETAGKVYVYTGDTGPSEAVTRLARGADILISEVVDPVAMAQVARRPGIASEAAFMSHMLDEHLSPEEVGKMAATAQVKEVVLTHIVPGFDDESSTKPYSEGVAKDYSGPVIVAADLQRF